MTTTTASSFDKELRDYLLRLHRLSGEYTASVFWDKLLSPLAEMAEYRNIKDLSAERLAELIEKEINSLPQMGYCFAPLDAGVVDVTQDADYRRAIDSGSFSFRLRRRFEQIPKDEKEHRIALMILKKHGMLDSYLEFIRPFRVKSSMSAARHFFYKRQLDELIREQLKGPASILEVGAGAGNLALFLHRSGWVKNYCIVDLPVMLLVSAHQIHKYAPDASIAFYDPESGSGFPSAQFTLVPAQFQDHVPSDAFDLCLNMLSFQEMDREARDGYLRMFYRVGKPGSLMFNVNRHLVGMPQRDGSTFENNPLLFPYEPTDRVLIWKECPFHQVARCAGIDWSLALMRAAVMRPELARTADGQ